ncbi:MAG: transposase family protein [Deltaproteobacteria bacterium]|nr:transposase family protein [Deltaproteobacteria bacterium]
MDVIKPLFMDVVREWEAAPHGQKGAVLKARLPVLGMSLASFHLKRRMVGSLSRRKPRADKGATKHPERRAWVKEIMSLKHSSIKGVSRLATWNAQGLALEHGLPPEAADMSVGVINKLARQMKLVETPRRSSRFEAPTPNYLHQVDASGSRHFYPYKTVGGEWILRLRPGQLRNKEQLSGLRVWCWGLVDDFSGFRVQRYLVSPGESALDGVDFLRWAWTPNPDHAPFEGLPQHLYMDPGVLAKYGPFKAFCEEVGIDLRTHEPNRPQATGKVETGNKDLKSEFEGRFMRDPGWRTREITLTELNQELAYFRQITNRTGHRRLPMPKESAWLVLNTQGGPVRLTPESWDKIFTQNIHRTLNDAGCFSLGGPVYQVAGRAIWSTRVRVYLSLTSDALVVEDLRDGARYAAGPYVPMVAGDYVGAPKGDLERLLDNPSIMSTGETPTPPSWKPAADGNLLHLVKGGEVRESSFEMPEIPPSPPLAKGGGSLQEMAAGVEIIPGSGARGQGGEEHLFATPWERYEHLIKQEARGETLTPEDVEFIGWFRLEYAELLSQVGAPPARAQLGLVE